ncbi:MAG: hypothetical protein IJS67_00315 [Clostridia bacterium]|nr:hypothetical protein [Clostridia bacterium]
MKVAKFGGTSLAGAEEFEKVATTVLKDNDFKCVVVSAGGATKTLPKVTDMLAVAYKRAARGEPIGLCLNPFYERVTELIVKLRLPLKINEIQMNIEREYERQPTLDFILSRGEYVYSLIMAKYLKRPFLDAAEVMKFNEDGTFNTGFSLFLIREAFSRLGGFVTGGFYGSLPDGKIKVLPRGGSDFSGAVVAAATGGEYYNFTDVGGFYSFDPHIVINAPVIGEISFKDARRLSEFGAGVLHPDSVLPLVGRGISVRIKNTFSPLTEGTKVSEFCSGQTFGVAIVKGCVYFKAEAAGGGYKILSELCLKGAKPVFALCDNDETTCLLRDFDKDKTDCLTVPTKSRAIVGVALAYLTISDKSEGCAKKIAEKKPTYAFIMEEKG